MRLIMLLSYWRATGKPFAQTGKLKQGFPRLPFLWGPLSCNLSPQNRWTGEGQGVYDPGKAALGDCPVLRKCVEAEKASAEQVVG